MTETTETDETENPMDPEDVETKPMDGRCNAITRGGGYCQNWPTEHGRCRFHGGGMGTGRPPETGRYSTVCRESLRQKYVGFLQDTNLRDLSCEIAIERALFAEYLSRFQDGVNLNANDVGRLMAWAGDIGKMVERVARMENASALTAREVQLLEVIIVKLLAEFLDEGQQAAFASRLSAELGSKGLLPQSVDVIENTYERGN